MESNASRRVDDVSLPQHLRRPSLPPPTGPLPPTPEATIHSRPLKPVIGSPDRLIGRPFLPSSSLPLWTTKRPDASHQSIRARGPTTVPFSPSTGSRDWARHSRSASDFRRATVVDRRLVQEQELAQNKPISPSYPSSATLQDSLVSSSSSSQRNVPLPLPPIPSARNSGDGLKKAGSSYSNSTKSGSSTSSHHRSLSQPVQGRLSSSIRRWFSNSDQMAPDVEVGIEHADVGTQGSGHRINASSTVPQSQTFYSLSSSDDNALDAHAIGESPRPGFVANFSRKPLKAIPDSEDDQAPHSLPIYVTDNAQGARAVGAAQSRFHTISSPNSNYTRTSSSGSGLEFGYIPFLTESGNSYQANGSNRGSQGSSRLRASAGVSTEDIVRDFRSLSRLSGLSHVSGGAAFIISEDGDGAEYIAGTASDFEVPLPLPRVGQPGPRIDSGVIFDGAGALVDSEQESRLGQHGNDNEMHRQGLVPYQEEDMGDKSESGIGSSNSETNGQSSSSSDHGQNEMLAANLSFRQLTPANMRIHPADQRYSHTYRVRQSTGDDPVLVPVYNFPTPGSFPNRNHLTLPNPNTTYAKHTRAADSMDIFDGVPPSNDSSERLIPVQGASSFNHQPDATRSHAANSSESSGSREKYSKSATVALMTGAGRVEGESSASANRSNKYRTEGSIAETGDPESRNTKSTIRAPQILPQQPKKLTGKDRFDQDHENDTIQSVASQVSAQERKQQQQHTHIPDLGSTPHLYRAYAAYSGDDIDIERWPDRFSRQQKIGRYMLVMCTFLPPLWLVLAAGGLDIFVNELTEGKIWTVGKKEKKVGMWLGSSFFAALLAAIITAGILVR